AGWRQEAHWEYDFRDPPRGRPEAALGLASDQCSLAVLRGRRFKYVHFAALPPLLFDLERDPGELVDRASDPDYAKVRLEMAETMLGWRQPHADRSLANHFITAGGVIERKGSRYA